VVWLLFPDDSPSEASHYHPLHPATCKGVVPPLPVFPVLAPVLVVEAESEQLDRRMAYEYITTNLEYIDRQSMPVSFSCDIP